MNKYSDKIKELEQEEKFNEHIVPVNPKHVKPLGKNFKYFPKNPLYKIYSAIIHGFLNVVGPAFTKIAYKMKIEGRRKLKGIKSAIVTCNHVMFTDNLISRVAVKKNKVFFAGDNFNNKKGLGGLSLRAGGFIPMGESYSEKVKFAKALERALKHNSYVVFFPEGSLWPEYEKPRPFKRGAFYYACKNDVPVIPVFICFQQLKTKKDRYRVITKILEPVYKNNDIATEKDQIKDMQEKTELAYKEEYEKFYNKKLTY